MQGTPFSVSRQATYNAQLPQRDEFLTASIPGPLHEVSLHIGKRPGLNTSHLVTLNHSTRSKPSIGRPSCFEGVTAHTLRHTFGSMAGEFGFSKLTIRAKFGHASQNVTQDYVHIDEAVKLAVERTAAEIESLLVSGAEMLKERMGGD